MSNTQIERPVKMENTDDKEPSLTKSCTKETEKVNNKKLLLNASSKKSKHENESRFKFGRKRSQSFIAGNGKFFPPYKRRKKESIIPPTKFLLGGNIRDPLNLNSLQDEEINKAMNAVTPKSSPLPTPHHRKGEIEVIIPPNLRDPLNLISGADDAEYEQQLVSPTKKGRKSRNRKKKRNSSSGGSTKDDSVDNCVSGAAEPAVAVEDTQDREKDVVIESAAQTVQTVEDNDVKEPTGTSDLVKEKEKKIRKSLDEPGKDKRNRKMEHAKDKIVSPVIPQPGAWKRPLPYGHRIANPSGAVCRNRPGGNQQKKSGNDVHPNFRQKDAKFQYGNYTRYYGYRNPMHEEDLRLKCFMQRPELFQDKDVLDIGCNIGHVTLMVARDLSARSVVGIDIDRKLIDIARKNVRHYVNCAESPPGDRMIDCPPNRFFPISMPILYGPVDVPGFTKGESPSVRKKFPHNVSFVQGNYVLESETLLGTEQPQFDVILCLSVTKWIHLNWGDAGLRQSFRRMFAQLRPGGHLILEAQSWDSYKRKKALTETIFRNFKSIEFFPHKFTQYLLSSEVGFSKCEVIDTPIHRSRGFQRPIQLFTKGENSPCHSLVSIGTTPSHQMAASRSKKPVYTCVTTLSEETGEEKTLEREQQSMELGKCEPSADIASTHVLAPDSPNTAKVGEHSSVTLGAESVDYESSVVDSVESQMELSVITEVSKENTVAYQDSTGENADGVYNRSNENTSNATANSTSSSSSSGSGSSPSCSNSDVERERGKAR